MQVPQPAAAPRPPAPEIPRRVMPTAEPPRSSAKMWVGVLAVLLVLALAGSAWVLKQQRDREAAELAARQQPSPSPTQATPGTTEAAPPADTSPAASQPAAAAGSEAAPAPSKPPESKPAPAPPPAPKPAAPAKVEKAEEKPPVAELLPDVSSFPLRLEVSASAAANVEITSDDNPPEMHSLREGGTWRAGANKILQVRTDNAGALHLKLNDQDMPDLGPTGSPRTVRYTAKNLLSTHAATAQQGGESSATRAGAKKTQVDVEVANLPKFGDFAVMVDGEVLFERAGVMEGGAESLSRTEAISPGTHTITVFLGNRKAGKGVKHDITGDFGAGQTRTLRVQTHFEGRRAPGMFMFDLSLE